MLLFLTLTANQINIQKVILDQNEAIEIIQTTLLLGYANFVYLISILISIVVVSDIIGGESALDLLILSTNRVVILIGKIISIVLIISVSQIFSFLAFFSVLITYEVPIPSLDIILLTWTLGILISIIPVSFAFFSSALTLRLNMSSHTAAYITIFIFFIIPSIIYVSLFQFGGFLLFSQNMLDFTINLYVQNMIVNSIVYSDFFGPNFQILYSISLILNISAIILFQTTPID